MAEEDVLQIILLGQNETNAVVNTFYYEDLNTGSVTRINCNTAASDWWTAWKTNLRAAAVMDTIFYGVRCDTVAGPNIGDVGFYAITSDGGGLYGDGDMPGEIAIAITRKAMRKGRKYRGRIFWGPVMSGMFSDPENGQVVTDDTALMGLTTVLASTSTLDAVACYPVLVHKAGSPPVYTPTTPIIAQSVVSPVCVHRRSRRLRFPV